MTDLQDLLTRNDTVGRPQRLLSFNDWHLGGKRMERFWIIFVEHTDGGRHYRHAVLDDAQKEAERLARLPGNQGINVYVFQCIGKCRVEETPVRWGVPR